MAITQMFVNFIDRTIGRLGFIKASEIPRLAQVLFAGENMRYQQDFMAQTEDEMQRLAVTNPWVYSNIRLISQRVALGRMMVEVQDGEGIWQEDKKHGFTKIMEQTPNPYMGQMFIWSYQMFWYLLRGESFWMQIPNVAGDALTQVYPLPANRIEPIPAPDTLFAGFEYIPTATGTPILLETEHVIFHRLPNPFNYNRGLSPLTAYVMGMQIDREVQKFDLEDYKQGLTLRHIISLRPETSDPDMIRYQREIDKSSKEGRRYMVTRGGDIKTAPVTVRRGTEKGSEQIRALTQKEADYVYGVPEGLRVASATQANATVAERTFISDTIWPLMVMVSEDMTVQSVVRYYGENERARFEDPRIADREMEMKEESHSWEYMTYDEVRNEQGLDEYWDPEIGKQKFTVVDDLIKMVFEMELKNSEREQALVEQETGLAEREAAITVAETPPQEDEVEPAPEDAGLEDQSPEPVPEAFIDEEGKGSEFEYWLKQGWLPELSFNDEVVR